MSKIEGVSQVGAPDPELRTSPIFDEESADYPTDDLEVETVVCYFNGAAFQIGEYVCSGNELLRCEERGIWVRTGACDPG